MHSMKRYEGYLLIDHTASPGASDDVARRLGLYAPTAKEGKRMEAATLTCAHCATVAIKNPERTRPRNYCKKCRRYICDGCGHTAAQPDYVHRSFQELADLVRSGRYTLHGDITAPVLVPTE